MLSHWSITKTGKFYYKGRCFTHKPWNIVHVEDHTIVADAIAGAIKPFFPFANITNIKNGDHAYSFFKESITTGRQIDFIITDIMHPGLQGHKLISALRELEAKYHHPAIPIIVVTMHEPTLLLQWLQPSHPSTFRYYSKGSDLYNLVDALEEMLYR